MYSQLQELLPCRLTGQLIFLTNALKYAPPEQPVDVAIDEVVDEVVDDVGDWARVSVRDEGAGLTRQQQRRLFERFYRVEGIEQQQRSGMGLGLGLSICRAIIERHGGRIGVESARGKGSTFWFELPLTPHATASEASDEASSAESDSGDPVADAPHGALVV